MTYFDFNSASEQTSFDLIPKGTLVRVRMLGIHRLDQLTELSMVPTGKGQTDALEPFAFPGGFSDAQNDPLDGLGDRLHQERIEVMRHPSRRVRWTGA